ELNKEIETPLYERICQQIRDDITDGKIAVGDKLPSKRKLGEFLDISQTTIELAYGQLVAEGFITSKPRKGYFVQEIGELAYVQPVRTLSIPAREKRKELEIDFSPGKIDTEFFPFKQWRKYA